MAGSSNFLIFDENKNNVMSDADYQASTQRKNGVIPGVAAPDFHNKAYRQFSVIGYALAAVMAERGFTVRDDDPAGVISAVRRAFAASVNGDKPDQSGDVQTGKPIDAWPIGSIFLSAVKTNPATLLGGGTWRRISGQYLLAADDSSYEIGRTYGAMAKTLTVGNLPAHNHSVTVGDAGGHSHSVTIQNGGAHTHAASSGSAGSHSHTASSASAGAHTHGASSNSTGGHVHAVSGNTGNAGAHSHGGNTLDVSGSFSALRKAGAGPNTGEADGKVFKRLRTYNASVKYGESDQDGTVFNFSTKNQWTGATSEASNHKHSISLTADSAGGHSHTITVNGAGGHAHGVTVNSNGNHAHGITVNEASAHTHGTTVGSAAAHKHSVTIGNTGDGTAINVMPLSIAVYVWQRTA